VGLVNTGKVDWFRFALALVNGTGTQDATYPANDNNAFKDVVGRLGGDFGFIVGGVSGYVGRSLGTKLTTSSPITGTDKNMDGMITPDELTIGSATTTAAYTRFRRMRVGADLTKETQTNSVFFTARISVDNLDTSTFKLVPGMPVEAFITDEPALSLPE